MNLFTKVLVTRNLAAAWKADTQGRCVKNAARRGPRHGRSTLNFALVAMDRTSLSGYWVPQSARGLRATAGVASGPRETRN
jgi:hypothetical protein